MDYSIIAQAVLPDLTAPGRYYAGTGFKKPTERVHRVDSYEEIAAIAEHSRSQDEDGITSHWSLGKFGENRKRASCLATRSVLVDIDVDKPFTAQTSGEAVVTIHDALDADSLPKPTFSFWTGGGVHLYWCPAETYTGDAIETTWMSMARAIRHWFADNFPEYSKDISKTTDRTCLVRMPMTYHGKTDKMGDVVRDGAGHPLSTLAFLSAENVAAWGALSPKEAVTPRAAPGVSAPTSLDGTVIPGTEAKLIEDPGKLFTQCAALTHLATKADQTYEEWFAVARLFAHSRDPEKGREAFHAFSSIGYGAYDPVETDTKFNDVLEANAAAPTCNDIRRNEKMCIGCPMYRGTGKNGRPHALQAEIEERRIARQNMETGLAPDPVTANIGGAAPAQIEAIGQPDIQPAEPQTSNNATLVKADTAENFSLPAVSQVLSKQIAQENDFLTKIRRVTGAHAYTDIADLGIVPPQSLLTAQPSDIETMYIDPVTGGLSIATYVTDGRKKNLKPVEVAHNPIFPMALVREENSEGGFVYGLKLAEIKADIDPVTNKATFVGRTVLISAEDVHSSGSKLRAAMTAAKLPLCAYDARAVGWQRMHKWIHEIFNALPTSKAEVKEYGFGWRREEYPNQRHFIIGDRAYFPDGTAKLIIQEGSSINFAKQMDVGGDLAAASQLLTELTSEATPELLFTLCAALGAPLMTMTSSKGVMINMPGRTGLGKTALLSLLNSLYSSARQDALPSSGGDTMMASMNIVGVFRHLPVMIDEVTLRTEDELGSFLMQLTQGHERNRMEASTNKLRTTASWATLVFSSSNKAIGEMISSHSDTAEAQRARVLEIFFDSALKAGGTRAFVDNYVLPMYPHGGVIGTAFIKYVLANYDAVRDAVAKTENALKDSDSPLNAKQGDKFRLWRSAATVAMVAANIGTGLGFWNLNAQQMHSIVANIAERATEQHQKDRIDPVEFVKNYIDDQIEALVIPQFLDKNGETIRVNEALAETTAAAPIAAGRKNAKVELIFQETKDYVEVSMARSALESYCRDHNIVLDYLVDLMKFRDIYVAPPKRGLRIGAAAGLSGRVNAGPEASRLIPPSQAVIVRLPLRKPFKRTEEPDYK